MNSGGTPEFKHVEKQPKSLLPQSCTNQNSKWAKILNIKSSALKMLEKMVGSVFQFIGKM